MTKSLCESREVLKGDLRRQELHVQRQSFTPQNTCIFVTSAEVLDTYFDSLVLIFKHFHLFRVLHEQQKKNKDFANSFSIPLFL